jgi:hypothetical protein
MADEIRATPRNQLLGLLADALQGGSNFASKPFGYDNPPVRGLLNLFQLPAITNTLNELSYGGALGTGQGMTYRPKADTLDAAMAVAPLLGGASRAINAGAAAVGQRLEPGVTELVNRTIAQGGRPAQLLQDLAQGTQSNMTVWNSSPGTWAGMTKEAYEAKQLANAQSGERMRSAWDDRMKEDLSQVLAQKRIYQPPPTQRDQDMKFLFSSYGGFINPKAARQMLEKNQLNASAKEINLLRKYYDNNGNLIPRSEP